MEDVDNELLQVFGRMVKEAEALIVRLVEAEMHNKILPSLPERVNKDFELLEVYLQTSYYGNIVRGDKDLAILGLQTAIRAAFLYGYAQAAQQNQDVKLTPLLGKFSGGIVQ